MNYWAEILGALIIAVFVVAMVVEHRRPEFPNRSKQK